MDYQPENLVITRETPPPPVAPPPEVDPALNQFLIQVKSGGKDKEVRMPCTPTNQE